VRVFRVRGIFNPLIPAKAGTQGVLCFRVRLAPAGDTSNSATK
jgi:hypothetical protein